jgi:hypothetical protein
MSYDFAAPAYIAAMTDAQLIDVVITHKAQINRLRDEIGGEFEYTDYMNLLNEEYWAQEELDQRAAVRRYSAPVALVNRPFAALAAAL